MGQSHGRRRPRPRDDIRYLAEAYFHQDHDLDADDPLDVVRAFVRAEGEEVVGGLRREIVRLLDDAGDGEVPASAWIVSTTVSYDPRRDGVSIREWFDAIVAVVDGRR
ncbi:contact-dependent growth inhibition system immunity protein [Cellulomonas algicola]|uniref:CdiI immunity protein domain-containing protein n=1 Tax=Cellulomonas algicola TaxID=2071633 RepID=A0A401UYE9_9CELL|nr:contact-dependent growth inhibition system immunity protein [Cellulomonas algicola]GCD19717.1 hypothetical protein CTKZ_12790 [Cellulomonas algicola]